MKIWKRLSVGLFLIPVIVKAQTLPTVPIYTYSVPSGGYASNGNVTNYTDSVTGTWNLGYDNLNRLTSGTVTPAVNQNQYFCWGYDSFGNRKIQAGSNQPFQTGSPTCQPASSATISNNIATYDNGNRITSTNANGVVIAPGYDAAGNLTDDGINQVLYDAENRVCAVFNRNTSAITQYIYDAEGRRAAKGHPANRTTLYCPTGPGDFIPDQIFVVGQNGEQVSELDSTGHWIHSNVYAGGQLLATYSQNGSAQPLHFNVTDHLGSKRVQTTAGGAVELMCLNLPFGDGLTCTGPGTDATEHHFTGKERDAESGIDYFGARYYGASMGRFMSPDHPLVDQHPENPQSWNLYAYVRNNPLINIDPTGLGCLTDLGQGSDENHVKVEINNSINSDDCAGQHGTWVPGDINKDNIGAYRGDDGNINFQVTTDTGGNVYYSSFVSGAQTDANGVGPGASIAHASADWLSSQIVGGGSLDQMMSFAAQRMTPRGGGGLMALLAGPGFSLDAPDNWAGPGGMGTPQGQGDWAAMAHDYNFLSNGITIGSYFNPFISRATSKALIQSDNNLIGHAGGVQAVKMGMLFGVVNAFQWLTHPF